MRDSRAALCASYWMVTDSIMSASSPVLAAWLVMVSDRIFASDSDASASSFCLRIIATTRSPYCSRARSAAACSFAAAAAAAAAAFALDAAAAAAAASRLDAPSARCLASTSASFANRRSSACSMATASRALMPSITATCFCCCAVMACNAAAVPSFTWLFASRFLRSVSS